MTSSDSHKPRRLPTPEQPDKRSFYALAPVVFLTYFVDNAYRMVAWFYLGAMATAAAGSEDLYRTYTTVAFTAPFLLLSLFAGQLADRFSKQRVVIGAKVLEVLLLLAGGYWLYVTQWKWGALVILFLLASRAALFGPSAYGLIPEVMPERRLSWANGLLEGLSYLAMILGSALGGVLFDALGRGETPRADLPVLVLGGISFIGLLTSFWIRKIPAAEPSRRLVPVPIRDLKANLHRICSQRGLFWAVMGNWAWWGMAVLAMVTAAKIGEDTLGLNSFQTSRLFIAVGLGVGLGSFIAGIVSRDKIELGLVPLCGMLMGFSCFLVYVFPLTELGQALAIGLVGFFAGGFIVPLKAFIQFHAPPESRGGILGTINLFQYAFVLLSGGLLYWVLTDLLGLEGRAVFSVLGVMAFGVGLFSLKLLPTAGLRLVLFLFTSTLYRVKVEGRERVPQQGGALLVCNHMSYADALVIISSIDRPIRMIMYEEIYNHPLVLPFAKLSGAIPVSSRMGPRDLIRTMQIASDAIRAGDLVGIFAEGQITRTGQLLPFRKGLERIMKDTDAPIVPMHLDRMWGSLLSYSGKRWLVKMPRRIPYPVTVSFGTPLPSTTPAVAVRKAVQELASEAWVHRREDARLLHHEAFITARRRPFDRAMYDLRQPNGMRRSMFAGATVAFAKLLNRTCQPRARVGVCIPPSIGGAIVNHALLLSGRVPVNLNYTVSKEVLDFIEKDAELDAIIASREFVEKLNLDLPGRVLCVEDLRKEISRSAILLGLAQAMTMPLRWLERLCGAPADRSVDDLATVIYSSGSTGNPKGVMLSHWNIFSNLEALGQVFSLARRDTILGILPFFHSFGTMSGLFLPHALGIGVVYYPNPLDANAIGELVRKHRVTMMVATPTFLQGYLRRVESGDFGSLQIVLAGAEKLRPSLAAAFEEKFGLRPMEGYGCTECSPAVTVNTQDFRAPGLYQRGAKSGMIGHPLPGVSIRIVAPETMKPLPEGEEGLMLVKGPNVMLGYLNQPEKTAEALRDGWYVTGDIARIDSDGFVEITDRLARFSKIGGEMVPHGRVEEALNSALDLAESAFAVASIPDEKRGERLVVLHTVSEEDARRAHEEVSRSGSLPNLWLPRTGDYFRIDAIPVLGTGKMDLRALREVALERTGAAADGA